MKKIYQFLLLCYFACAHNAVSSSIYEELFNASRSRITTLNTLKCRSSIQYLKFTRLVRAKKAISDILPEYINPNSFALLKHKNCQTRQQELNLVRWYYRGFISAIDNDIKIYECIQEFIADSPIREQALSFYLHYQEWICRSGQTDGAIHHFNLSESSCEIGVLQYMRKKFSDIPKYRFTATTNTQKCEVQCRMQGLIPGENPSVKFCFHSPFPLSMFGKDTIIGLAQKLEEEVITQQIFMGTHNYVPTHQVHKLLTAHRTSMTEHAASEHSGACAVTESSASIAIAKTSQQSTHDDASTAKKKVRNKKSSIKNKARNKRRKAQRKSKRRAAKLAASKLAARCDELTTVDPLASAQACVAIADIRVAVPAVTTTSKSRPSNSHSSLAVSQCAKPAAKCDERTTVTPLASDKVCVPADTTTSKSRSSKSHSSLAVSQCAKPAAKCDERTTVTPLPLRFCAATARKPKGDHGNASNASCVTTIHRTMHSKNPNKKNIKKSKVGGETKQDQKPQSSKVSTTMPELTYVNVEQFIKRWGATICKNGGSHARYQFKRTHKNQHIDPRLLGAYVRLWRPHSGTAKTSALSKVHKKFVLAQLEELFEFSRY